MRILQVRFKNLNSLVGEWEIDLTQPAFVADGIFAITGPTGAGKTTILDAICLALYGRTPRLNKVTKSGNEIMSRQTGECFAEVTFATLSGHYRCHWSQHRARRKPDGELQPPKHELADAKSGAIAETKLRGVAEQIETVTGMDFDRFTRSMLLAQGSFAAFLQAAPDDRAPILEQITGTEIYSEISVQVHCRRAEEKKKQDALEYELQGMQLLAPEDEQLLGANLEQKKAEANELNQGLEQQQRSIAWVESIARLELEQTRLAERKTVHDAEQKTFLPLLEKLHRANRALELGGQHSALQVVRQAQAEDQCAAQACHEALPSRRVAAVKAEAQRGSASAQLDTAKARQHAMQPTLRRVRELDLNIGSQEKTLGEAETAIAAASASLDAERERQRLDCAELQSKSQALVSLQQQQAASQVDEQLVENFTGLQQRIQVLQGVHGQHRDKLAEVTQAQTQLRAAAQAWQQQTKKLEQECRQRDAAQASLAATQDELQQLLEQRPPVDWRAQQEQLIRQNELLSKAAAALQAQAQSRQAVQALDRQQAALLAREVELGTQLEQHSARQASLENEMQLLETQLTLLQRIEDLEEARQQLQDGEACPLCGAIEHPFAAGNVPQPDTTREQLERVRRDLKTATAAVTEANINAARVQKDLEQVTQGLRQQTATGAESGQLFDSFCAQLAPALELSATDAELGDKLQWQQAANAEALARVGHVLVGAEKIDQARQTLLAAVEQAREVFVAAERALQTAAHQQEVAGQQLQRLEREAQQLQAQQQQAMAQLQQELEAFGITALAVEGLQTVIEQLAERRQQWLTGQQKKLELEQKVAKLELQSRHQAEHIQATESGLEQQQARRDALGQQRHNLLAERRELFGDRQPDQEDAGLTKAIYDAEQALEAARATWLAATRELDRLETRAKELQQAIAARETQLAAAQAAFLTRLTSSSFNDEADYLGACLPERERSALAQQQQQLADEKTRLDARMRENSSLLQLEREKRLTEQSLAELQAVLATLLGKQKQWQQDIGALQQKLQDNADLKQRQQDRAAAIDAQKRECARWNLLHDLIGSADGKKYRNFAQGLTFEMMVGHANRQLQKMTDRYLLIRDTAQPLELNVIDNYQAGEIRSTKNLSGGESFIVSLALALGLSQMASKKVRVDSLFLDEGFGTLDEEALEVALDTLSELQHEGKMIGVISHVPALKERISTQIQITPSAGGRSTIAFSFAGQG